MDKESRRQKFLKEHPNFYPKEEVEVIEEQKPVFKKGYCQYCGMNEKRDYHINNPCKESIINK